MGSRGFALPRMRQLHRGLSDLLLHHDRRPRRSLRPERGARAAMGFLLYPGLQLSPRREREVVAQVALPAVDDAQTWLLDRSVWNFGMRRMWPVHYLVPGRYRYNGRGGRYPRLGAPRPQAMSDER